MRIPFRGWWLIPGALLFALAYTQAPLYYSNQNQYYLHGLAQAERGQLADDWLANTADPTPLFTALVASTDRLFDDYAFHIYYVVIFGIYVGSLLGIWMAITQPRPNRVQAFVFFAGLVLLHAALPRWLSCQLWDVDYPWYFQAGLAGQYLLGSMFQPSVFGVFLLLSICCFVMDKPFLAAALASLAGVLHSTYLLEGAVLVVAYLFVLTREERWRTGLLSALLALGLVVPSLVYIVRHFAPSTPEAAEQARAILVHFRIPHHTQVETWLDAVAGLQILGVAGATFLVRRTRLFPIMLISFVAAVGLTLTQWWLGSDFLALLFPWRISTYLVPLATAILVGKLTLWLVGLSETAAWLGAGVVLATCVGGGIVIMEHELGYLRGPAETALYEHVRANVEKGDVYLVPYKLPNLPGPKGSRSSDFVLEDDRTGKRIPLEMQRFRLATGAPIFVDFKAIPYRDVDVLEWRRRIDVGLKLYADLAAGGPTLAREGITHVVAWRGQEVDSPQLQMVYQDPHWVIYRFWPENTGR